MKRFIPLLVLPFLSFAQEEKAFPRPPEKEITIEAQPWVKNCIAEPYVEGEFLYWKVAQENLEYGATGFGDQSREVTQRGKIYTFDFEGRPGFRGGIGANIAHDGWDVFLRYTWIYSKLTDRARVDLNEQRIRVLWLSAPEEFLHGGVNEAQARWQIHMNALDLEWGRNAYLSRYLTLHPFFGLKGYWSDQKYRAEYDGFFQRENGPQERANETAKMKQDSWGIGVRFGLNSDWYLSRNWSVYANLALASLWSHFDVHRRDEGFNFIQNQKFLLVNTKLDTYYLNPILELGVGVCWEMWFADDTMHALIQVGWEEQLWWGMNHFTKIFDSTSGRGNLEFQGLSLRFRFDF